MTPTSKSLEKAREILESLECRPDVSIIDEHDEWCAINRRDAERIATALDEERKRAEGPVEVLEFYTKGSSWTTSDDENSFIKIVDAGLNEILANRIAAALDEAASPGRPFPSREEFKKEILKFLPCEKSMHEQAIRMETAWSIYDYLTAYQTKGTEDGNNQ